MTEFRIYDTPDLQVVTFDTEFGKFGLMTCFDALFSHPFIDLIEAQGKKRSQNMFSHSFTYYFLVS